SAANAISYTFNSDGVNPILWMAADLQGVLMGTQAGEWLVQAPTAGPISPLNISARNVTRDGRGFLHPVAAQATLLFRKRACPKPHGILPGRDLRQVLGSEPCRQGATYRGRRDRRTCLHLGRRSDHLGPRQQWGAVRHYLQAGLAGILATADLLRLAPAYAGI